MVSPAGAPDLLLEPFGAVMATHRLCWEGFPGGSDTKSDYFIYFRAQSYPAWKQQLQMATARSCSGYGKAGCLLEGRGHLSSIYYFIITSSIYHVFIITANKTRASSMGLLESAPCLFMRSCWTTCLQFRTFHHLCWLCWLPCSIVLKMQLCNFGILKRQNLFVR